MAAHPVTHPSADVLRAFALGKLNDRTAEALMNHLDGCRDCCKQVAAISGDDFLARLRQARSHCSTSTPAKASSETAGGKKPTPNRPALADIPPELAANQQYEIQRELGRGGMGVVYLAKNKLMDRLEVLKVVNKSLLDHPAAVDRFLREIRSAAKLSHNNVVTAYSAVQQGELLAFAMEYIEGQDLASLVKSQGPLSVPHACFYVQQAAHGLQHAYEKGMVHRDIKPQNLILAREGKKHIVKVLDFGLAKLRSENKEDTGLTGEGKMLGTPDYIAPEQTLDAAHADIRADIYSLGCTLYYLLSGHPPFSGSSMGAVLVAHQMQEAKPLNLVRPEVPEELAAVVRKMMTKTPAKRYQTPQEVAQALSPYVKQGAMPTASPQLSVSAALVNPAVKKAASVVPPPVPIAEAPKKQAEPAAVWESLTEDSAASVVSRTSRETRRLRAATVRERFSRQKWLIGVAVLLLALLGMWASGVFNTPIEVGGQKVIPLEAQHPAKTERVDPVHSVVETWIGSFPDGGKWSFIFSSDHSVVGDNQFSGRWDQTGHRVIVITEKPAPGYGRKWEGEIDQNGETMTLTNDRSGAVGSYVRRTDESLTPSVAGSWNATFQDGEKEAKSIFAQSDHTLTSTNGFKGRWEQTGRKVIVIDANDAPGIDRKWEGEIHPDGKTMTLSNATYGVWTFVRP